MGGSASCCDLFSQQRSHSPHSKTAESIKEKTAHSKASTPYLRPIGILGRYLYQPGHLEGGGKRATDPVWTLKVFHVEKKQHQMNERFQ
ncbi:unnamed protein product [Porites evermanni]|uniref:Uncharacterized protein n=1 Tax=Porites evermanni TaxID=104178 RepID=A0ABN8Q4P5_9CNID|nr:unnamed protein product [Porites evermanni]